MRLLPIIFLLACDGGEPKDDVTDTDTDLVDETDADTDDTVETDITDTDVPSPWTVRSHPCVGNRTDALLRDSRGIWWTGCGTTTTGTGIFYSDDEGASWSSPVTTPLNYFDDFRVNDISEYGGRIYAAGDNNGGGGRSSDSVVSFDPTASPAVVDTELESGNQVWNAFVVGTYRQTDAGLAVAESLNGTGVVYRETPAGPWLDGADWSIPGKQMLDLEELDGGFYGCGSTIADAPRVMLPPPTPSGGFELTSVELTDAYDGEMWDVLVDDEGIAVGGVDQDGDVGKVFLSGTDPYTPSDWTEISLDTWFPSRPTWVHGLCRRGDTLVIVGRFSNVDDAIVLRSTDGGATFDDISPDEKSAYACQILEDDRIVIAGMQGLFAIWEAPE